MSPGEPNYLKAKGEPFSAGDMLRLTPDLDANALSEGRADGNGGLSARSVVYHHRILSKALDYTVRMGAIARNVTSVIDPSRVAKAKMDTLNAEGVARFLEAPTQCFYPILSMFVVHGQERSRVIMRVTIWTFVQLETNSRELLRTHRTLLMLSLMSMHDT